MPNPGADSPGPSICLISSTKPGTLETPLEQRRTSGGKGMEYRLPKCGNVFLNHNHCLPRCNAELAALARSGKKRWHVRRPNRNRLYLNARGGEFGITARRLHVSLPAPSPGDADAKIPCLSSAGPPLLQRAASESNFRTMIDDDPSPRSSSVTRQALTVALVKPGRGSWAYQPKNSSRAML